MKTANTLKPSRKISKSLFWSGMILLLAAIGAILYFWGAMIFYHGSAIQQSHEYKETSETKGEYTLTTHIVEKKPAVMAGFKIWDSDGTLLFECKGGYRTMDLKSVAFAEDSYDILVDSGDVGLVRYPFADGTWQEPTC